jgi:hypothetical protein
MNVHRKLYSLSLVAILLIASHLGAQSVSATLSGTVQDQTKAVIPGARVTIVNMDTSFRRDQVTNEKGYFSLSNLSPGRYAIVAQRTGFGTTEERDIMLSANSVQSLILTLAVAKVQESVTVVDRPALVNLSPAVSNTIDHQLIAALPIDGRSIQSLITLTPGIQLAPIYGSGGNPGQFSVNGMRSDANYFTIDGVSANFGASAYGGYGGLNDASAGSTAATDTTGSFGNLVSIDDLQEIQIQTSTYAPEFGRSPGAQISMVTRSGTNKFHGALYEYFRNDALDATDWFANYLGTGKTALRYNDFGGVFGGPVDLPKYDGRKRHTFFFFSYEANRFVLPQPAVSSIVPSMDARQNAPTTVSQEILNAFPKPNGTVLYTDSDLNPCTPGSSDDCQPNGGAFYTTGFSNPSHSNVWSLRVDQNVHDKYTFFARYNHGTSGQADRNAGTGGNASEINNNDTTTDTLTIGTTQTFTPRLINQFTINGSKQSTLASATQDTYGGAVPLPSSVVFPASPCVGCGAVINIEGFTNDFLPTEISLTNPTYSRNGQINAVDNLTYDVGEHQLKFGVDYRYLSPTSAQESMVFGDYFANVQALYANSNEFGLVAYDQEFSAVFNTFSAYAQDTWKANRRLTLTYGLRWDVNPAPHGRHGKEPLTVQSLNLDTLDFTYLALAPAGTHLYPTSYTNIAPRFGFSYAFDQSPSHELVLRGGAGIFYDLGQNGFGNIGFPYNQSYFFGPGGAVGNNPPFTLPVPAEYAQAPPPDATPSPDNPASLTVASPNYKVPRAYEWNVTLERSFGANTVASLAYVGSLGRDMEAQEQYIFAAPGTPLVPVSANFSELEVIGNLGVSNFNSLQGQLHSRFDRHFETEASYTWSHAIDNGSNDAIQFIPSGIVNPDINHGNSDYDVRNSFSDALTYTIPSVAWKNPVAYALKDWALNGMFNAHSALPFDVISQNYSPSTNGGYYTLRADTVPGQSQWIHAKYLPGTQNLVPGGKYLNPDAFTDPGPEAAQGDLPRNSLRGFGFWQLDFGIHRQIPITDHAHLQFRAEMFNILNHPNFANPGLSQTNAVGYPSPGSPGFPLGFGEASESIAAGLGGGGNTGGFNPLFQQGGPRAVQLALRLEF